MIEDNKYYIPDIESIYIGYEYEYKPWDWKNGKFLDNWKQGRYVKEKSLHKLHNKYIVTGNLRTKWLDKEDIESCGWKRTWDETSSYGDMWEIVGEDVTWELNLYEGTIDITEWGDKIYKGKCPSINELKTLMKWLQINNTES